MLSAHLWACKFGKYGLGSESWDVRPMMYGERFCLLVLKLLFSASMVFWSTNLALFIEEFARLGESSRWHVVLFQILPLCREHEATEVT
jgi:hypothetical protein